MKVKESIGKHFLNFITYFDQKPKVNNNVAIPEIGPGNKKGKREKHNCNFNLFDLYRIV